MAIDYSKAYTKIPRSRLSSKADGDDTIVKYRDASPQARAGAGPYKKPAPKNTPVIYKTPAAKPDASSAPSLKKDKLDAKARITDRGVRGLSPATKAPPAPKAAPGSVGGDYAKYRAERVAAKDPRYSKGSTQPPAYKGAQGDTATKRGAVTSYQKDGYNYTKNAQGNYQNFKAGAMPAKRKGSDR